MDEIAADGRPIGLSEESAASGQLDAEYRRLVAEGAAVRRVGTRVVRGGEPSEVVGALADEMCRCAGAFTVGIWRFQASEEISLVAGVDPAALAKWHVEACAPIDSDTLATVVYGAGLPARMDSCENIAGSIATRVRAASYLRLSANGPFVVWPCRFGPWIPRRCQRSNRRCAVSTCTRRGGRRDGAD